MLIDPSPHLKKLSCQETVEQSAKILDDEPFFYSLYSLDN